MHTNQQPVREGVPGSPIASRAGWMRVIAGMVAVGLVGMLAGCVTPPGPAAGAESKATGTNAVVLPPPIEPLDGAVGRVVRVQSELRFVVVDYSLNRMPEPDRMLAVYRGGEVVGRLKAGRFRRETTLVADIVSGSAAEGDEVRGE